uniref:Putative methyltransferase family protein n=1 Tax=Tanacetum cinerariifolium TaxID=118510 RepID=A0A6L2LHX8_TANCI|nr:putative methyltransferase family protein [Tanacetum cinerariifolium]
MVKYNHDSGGFKPRWDYLCVYGLRLLCRCSCIGGATTPGLWLQPVRYHIYICIPSNVDDFEALRKVEGWQRATIARLSKDRSYTKPQFDEVRLQLFFQADVDESTSIHLIMSSVVIQGQCPMHTTIATTVNRSQQKQPQANGEKVCIFQTDVKIFDKTNAQVISRTTVTLRVGRAHKRHGKHMYQYTADMEPPSPSNRVPLEYTDLGKCTLSHSVGRSRKLKGLGGSGGIKNAEVSEGRLRWFGHVKRRPQTVSVRRAEAMLVAGSRRRGIPKLRWEDKLKHDMKELLLSEDITSDRIAWKDRIRISW